MLRLIDDDLDAFLRLAEIGEEAKDWQLVKGLGSEVAGGQSNASGAASKRGESC